MSPAAGKRKPTVSENYLLTVADYPHILGHIIGKTKLTDVHSDWIKWIWKAGRENRALQAHRGSYKTTAVSLVGSIWWTLFHPDDRIALIRKSFTDAAQVTTAISNAFQLPELQYIFYLAYGEIPKLIVDKYGAITFSYKRSITPENSITALGLDGGITGKHFDKIITDDIITLKDRISISEREKTKEMSREIMTNIIDNGQGVGFIGTPWHRNDAWTIIEETSKMAKYPISRMSILTEEEIEIRRKRTTPALFALNYDLDIRLDDTALFKEVHWLDSIFNSMLPGTVAHVDAGYWGNNTCALTILSRIPGQHKFQGKGWCYAGNIKDWIPFIIKTCKAHRVAHIYNELNADKGYTADKLKEGKLSVRTYNETQNKAVKISTHLYNAWDNILWDENTDPEYLNQILDWREGQEPDDAPDSVASLLREAFNSKVEANRGLYEW